MGSSLETKAMCCLFQKRGVGAMAFDLSDITQRLTTICKFDAVCG
jgi:hypothetical protein